MYYNRMTNTILDWRTKVLAGRSAQMMSEYIPEKEHRRMQVTDILARYMAADSSSCLSDLSASHQTWWTDTGLVYMLSGAFTDLTLYGARLVIEDADQDKLVRKELRRMRFWRLMRQAERFCSAYGDGVVEVRWDEDAKRPRLEVYMPSMYLKTETGCVLFWTVPEKRDQVYITQYAVGKIGRPVGDGIEVDMTSADSVGMIEGWTAEDARSGLRNVRPLDRRLGNAYVPLPCSAVPVVVIPNGDQDINGFGVSDFWNALDLVDEHTEVVTDGRIGSQFLIPPIQISGERPPGVGADGKPSIEYEPGMMYWTGENGNMTVPDFTPMVKGANEQADRVWNDILKAVGLSPAAVGDVGEVSNRRDREVRLMYMPVENKIMARREDRLPYWESILARIAELWMANDAAGYEKVFGDINLAEVEIGLDDILPQDIAEYMSMLSQARNGGAMPRKLYAKEAFGALGINEDAELAAVDAAAEEAAGFGAGGFSPVEPAG